MGARKQSRPTAFDPLVVASEAEAAADQILLPQAPEADALPAPDSIDELWVEREYAELEIEQTPLWDAEGQVASRPAQTTASGLGMRADSDEWLTHTHAVVVEAARERLLLTVAVLMPHRRRAKGMKLWYQVAKFLFVFGDTAGFASAALWLGEEIPIAITLALSAAVATVAAGLVGVELRDSRSRQRRHRPVDELTEQERVFAHLFTKEDPGAHVVRHVVLVSAAAAGAIGIGIGALRAAVDDPLIGFIFGGIALAVAGGSFLVSYAGADEVSDLIDHAEADYERAVEIHRHYAAAEGWKRRSEMLADAESIRAEHVLRGKAAGDHIRALKARILRQNPHVAGHGPAAAAPPVGRTTRKETR